MTGQGIPQRGLKPAAQLAAERGHGIRLTYVAGCRCAECRKANCEYQKARSRAQKAGDWNGIVPAAAARAHMLKLSKQGVGRRAVGAVTDIGDSILHAIRSGEKKNIRARTERRILAVTKEMASGGALVDAKPTWKLINKLLNKGYTKTQIAHALGVEKPALQINKVQVTVQTAYDVEKLYKKCEELQFSDAAHPRVIAELPAGTYSPRPGVLIHRMGA